MGVSQKVEVAGAFVIGAQVFVRLKECKVFSFAVWYVTTTIPVVKSR